VLAGRSFAAGMTDFLVLLNSEVALLAQQQERAQITARMLEGHAGLMVALGGGYLPEQDDMQAPGSTGTSLNRLQTDKP
jgi:outer membrane protein TolC